MKKFLIFPLMAVAMMFVGCSDDDDNGGGGSASPASVVGTWNVTSTITVFEIDTVGTTEEFELSTESCSPTPTTVFNADGTMTTAEFELDFDFEGNEDCEVFGDLSGTYEQVEGDTYLIQVGEDEPETARLVLSNGNNTLDIVLDDDDDNSQFIIRHSRQ